MSLIARRRRVCTGLTFGIATSLLLASFAGAGAPPLQPIDPPITIAAIGDSVIAGQGLSTPIQPIVPRCRRTTGSYPRLVTSALRQAAAPNDASLVTLVDASCSGATTRNFAAEQTTYVGVNPPQRSTLSAAGNIDYLLIGFGANDAGLFTTLNNCRDIYRLGRETCRSAMSRTLKNPFDTIAASRASITAMLDDARSVAPNAKTIVVGYPAITTRDANSACVATMSLPASDMRFIDDQIVALNSMLKSVAIAKGVPFIDPHPVFVGHDACASSATRWIEPPSNSAALPTDHPNATGYQQIANLVLAAIPDRPRKYVSLGDSYTAGHGVNPQLAENIPRCRRSTISFPRLVEAKLEAKTGSATSDDLVQHTDASCSGADASHTTRVQETALGQNPPQFDRLSVDTTDVTIGFGANDSRLLAVLGNCRYVYSTSETCAASFFRNGSDPYGEIENTGTALRAAIDGVRSRSPVARIWVVGYPTIVPGTAQPSCEAALRVKAIDMPFFDAILRALNAEIKTAAIAKRVEFVDTYTPSIGHDSCQPVGIRWIEPLTAPSALARDHPNALGQAAIAEATSRAMLRNVSLE